MGSLDYLLAALTPLNLLLALAGVVAGTVIGALPGLTATMAVAVLVPFTFAMEPAAALIALGAIYTGAIYGGAYAAILLNTPGTPSSIATTFDGYPMARAGRGDLALTLACLSSVVGGLVGAGFLLLLAPPMATVTSSSAASGRSGRSSQAFFRALYASWRCSPKPFHPSSVTVFA